MAELVPVLAGMLLPSAPNQELQQTAAAILVPRNITAHSAAATAELWRSARAAEFQGVVMPKYLVFCFHDDSYDPDYDKPAGPLAECGLAKRWSYGTTVDAALPYQVWLFRNAMKLRRKCLL